MNEALYRTVELRLWSSLGLEPTERRVDLDRLGTTVRVQEVGDGPIVLFVHGGSASGANWAPLVARLDQYRCVLLDRPGCGLSAPASADLTDLDRFGRFAGELIADVLDGLGEPSAPVVATSLGGHIALRSAATHPERIPRMVDFGYVPGAPLDKVPTSMRIATLPGLQRLMTSIPPTRGAVRAILRQLGMGEALSDGRISPELFDWFHSLLRDTPTMRNETNLPREMLQKTGKQPQALPSSVLAAVRCPVRFIWAEDDPIGGTDSAKSFVKLVPDAELDLWSDVGHAPWIVEPGRAAAAVADFLGR